MKWFTYMRRTSWTQICADIKEYQNLWRQYFALCADKSDAYTNLIEVFDADRDNRRKMVSACIRHIYYFVPLTHNIATDSNNSQVFARNSVCRRFGKNGDYIKCANLDCPSVQRNHDYVDACVRLDMARRARCDFWQNKFANIK